MKKKLVMFFALTLSLLLLLTSCGAPAAIDLMADVHAAEMPAAPAEPEADYIDSVNQFSWKLFQETIKTDDNLLMSPTSVYMALSLALNGADTTTRAAMLQAMAANLTVEQLNTANRDWKTLLMAASDKIKLSISNSIWYRNGFQVDPVFLQTNADFYSAAARMLDFDSPNTIKIINDWVKTATNGKINEIIGGINPNDLMYLINAVYFKADWQYKFNKDQSSPGIFTSSDGRNNEVTYMGLIGDLSLLSSEYGEGVLLPYVDDRFALVAILPDGKSARETVQAMTPDSLNEMIESKQIVKMNLKLPRFETRSTIPLSAALEAMGMAEMFSQADFSLMVKDRSKGLSISGTIQKSYFKIDETGTEAAAVTAFTVASSLQVDDSHKLKFDRPFIYGIIDTVTGLPLFLGIMDNPNAVLEE